MKTASRFPLIGFFLAAGAGVLLFLGLTVLADVLLIGDKLHGLHPYAETIFYLVLMIVVVWFCLIPLLKVIFAPSIHPNLKTGHADPAALKKVAARLFRDKSLPYDIRVALAGVVRSGSDPRNPVHSAIQFQTEGAQLLVRNQAVIVFLTTAFSQNGIFDSISTLLMNLRLIHQIVEHFGCRPSLPQLLKLYIEVLLASLLADKVEDLNFDTMFLHAGGLMDAIPGTRVILDSALDGTINALLTLRIGFVTMEYLMASSKPDRSELRRRANQMAIGQIWPVIKEGAAQAPGALKSILGVLSDLFRHKL